MDIQENGPWSAYESGDRVGVQSDDFHHDAILWLDGDFGGHDVKLAYAAEIAKRLNAQVPEANAFLHRLAEMAPKPGEIVAMTMTMAIGSEAKRILGDMTYSEQRSLLMEQQAEIERLKSEIFKRDLGNFVAQGGFGGLVS